MDTKLSILTVAGLLCGVVEGGIVMNITQEEDGVLVVASGSVSIEAADWQLDDGLTGGISIGIDGRAGRATVGYAAGRAKLVFFYDLSTLHFGNDFNWPATSSGGGLGFGIDSVNSRLVLPSGYVSGTQLNGWAKYSGATIDEMKLFAGTYSWSWPGGSFAIHIQSPPTPPTNVTATAVSSTAIDLSWTDTSDCATGFKIQQGTFWLPGFPISYSTIATTASNVTSYSHTGLEEETEYFYRIIPTDSGYDGEGVTISATAGTSSDTTPPAAPSGLVATGGDGSVTLDWDDNGESDMDSYSVYRSTISSNYSTVLVTGLNSSDYTDNTVSNGITYYYVVTATDSNNNQSAHSIEVSAAPATAMKGYEKWLSDNGIEDTHENFYEYAMASDPTDGLAPTNGPTFTKDDNRFLYVHPQRSDDDSLIYTIETTTDLAGGTWTNEGYTVMGTKVTGGDLDFVTNDVDTVDNEKFIRLKIEQ